MKCGMLIGIEVVMAQFAVSHTTNGMDKILMEQIFEPVLIRVVRVGTTIEIVSRRILTTLLVTCILRPNSVHV